MDKNIISNDTFIRKIKQVAFAVMGESRPHQVREKGFIFYHGLRTAKLALALKTKTKNECKYHNETIFTGALFHDVGKGKEPHNEAGAKLVKDSLCELFSVIKLEEISQLVLLHNKRNIESELSDDIKIVQDADVLDHFGTLEIWLKFLYSAYNNENVFDALKYWKSTENQKYLKGCRTLLNFEISRKIYDEKIKFTKSFIDRFSVEIEGKII